MAAPEQLAIPSDPALRFAEPGLLHDLAAGTIANPAGERLIYLSRDAIRSLQQTLREDTGDAWKPALRRIGLNAGRRLARTLPARELTNLPDAPPSLQLGAAFLERTFLLQGWGRMVFDFSLLSSQGLVLARVAHSCWAEVLRDTEDFADPFVSGLLQGFCSSLAGVDFACEELECARTTTGLCTFVLAAPARLQAVDGLIGLEPMEAVLAALQHPTR